jgi:hypothetical protein
MIYRYVHVYIYIYIYKYTYMCMLHICKHICIYRESVGSSAMEKTSWSIAKKLVDLEHPGICIYMCIYI